MKIDILFPSSNYSLPKKKLSPARERAQAEAAAAVMSFSRVLLHLKNYLNHWLLHFFWNVSSCAAPQEIDAVCFVPEKTLFEIDFLETYYKSDTQLQLHS